MALPIIVPIVVALVIVGATLFFMQGKKLVQLDPRKYKQFKLIEKLDLINSPGCALTMLFRFELPAGSALALPTGQHITIKAVNAEGDEIMRQYTPTTNENVTGHFDVVIKIYPNGAMGNYLKELPIGSMVDIKGPQGKFHYKGDGQVGIKRTHEKETIYDVSHLGMVAGGSGLTPMYQIIQNLTQNGDNLPMTFLYGNVSQGDIILKSSLDDLASQNKNLTMWYTVDKCEDKAWPYTTGFMNAELFKQKLPAPGPKTLILLCGPPGLIGFATKLLKENGYTDEMLFTF